MGFIIQFALNEYLICLIGKRKDKKDKKDRGYATLDGESSPEEDHDTKLVYIHICIHNS